MDDLFLLLFFVSIVSLIVGLIKPSAFSFLKKEMTRKNVALLFGISAIAFFVLFGVTTESTAQNQQKLQENENEISKNKEINQQPKNEENEQSETENQSTDKAENVISNTTEQTENKTKITTKEPVNEVVKENTPVIKEPEVKTQTARDDILAILKTNASTEWGNDYEMVQYEYNNQVQSYDLVIAQTKYPEIMVNAKQEWGHDYEMVKYEYNNQAEAYDWIMTQTDYPDIMNSAKQEWGDDYEMVKYEYNNQVEAYKNL